MQNMIKTSSKERIHKVYKKKVLINGMPEEVYSKYIELLNDYILAKEHGDKKEINSTLKKANQYVNENSQLLFNKTHHVGVYEYMNDKKLAPLAVDITKELIEEYDCKNSSEVHLCEVAAMAYCRYLKFSGNGMILTKLDYLSTEKTNFYNSINKEADRAFKQYVVALNTLKTWRTPRMNISINTNSAFVANNQQLNNIENVKSN